MRNGERSITRGIADIDQGVPDAGQAMRTAQESTVRLRNPDVSNGTLYRLSAFSSDPGGGNPAGVWIGMQLPDASTMQQIAAQVGYSETAFIAPEHATERVVRYYSPQAEVPFCGHATIASGVLLGEIDGDAVYRLSTRAGLVPVSVETKNGVREAALTSVTPRSAAIPEPLLDQILGLLQWSHNDMDPAIPPILAYAGAWHLVLATKTRERLADLDYPFDALRILMLANDLTTLQLVHRQSEKTYLSRNPFPVGGIVEDPATGAAAAAFGGYLRDSGLLVAPASFVIEQGDMIGRPSRIHVDIPTHGGIIVRGTAVRL